MPYTGDTLILGRLIGSSYRRLTPHPPISGWLNDQQCRVQRIENPMLHHDPTGLTLPRLYYGDWNVKRV